jgi:dTDP-4-amino-4,6-dideoxygalactose transaminase
MPIPFLDLTRSHRDLEAETTAAAARVLESGAYILGREVEAFEEEWASFCDVKGAVGVGNGTDALTLALIASGAICENQRDEVITPTLSAAYTALAIRNAGGIPSFADINPQTYTLDPHALEQALTPRTRAIIPVHLYGQLADMEAIHAFAARHELIVIEDAAQSHGARLAGQTMHQRSLAATHSFYPTKNLGAYGDGGAIVSNDTDFIERARTLRQGGHAPALEGEIVGRNSRLDEMQAALLRVKLKRLAEWNVRRQQLAQIYRELLAHKCPRLQLPAPQRESKSHVYHLYVVQHPERERLRAFLHSRGIETLIHYPYLLHQQTLFCHATQHPLPVAERVVEMIFSLPLYPQLRDEEALAVCQTLLEFENIGSPC